jgi:DNA-binding NtrC family response regulator
VQDSPQRILVVEDEEDMAVLLRRALERRGFSVDLASDGAEALAALASHPYALLITDIFMPRMNGLRLLEAARQRWPHLPVILITGLGDWQSYVRAMDLHVAAYLTKPVRIGDILAAVERALDPQLPA